MTNHVRWAIEHLTPERAAVLKRRLHEVQAVRSRVERRLQLVELDSPKYMICNVLYRQISRIKP